MRLPAVAVTPGLCPTLFPLLFKVLIAVSSARLPTVKDTEVTLNPFRAAALVKRAYALFISDATI
jgi:hypothetical protein